MLLTTLKSIVRSFATDYQLPRSRLIAHQCIVAASAILALVLVLEISVDLNATTSLLLVPAFAANIVLLLFSGILKKKNLGTAQVVVLFVIVQSHLTAKPEYFHVIIYWIPFLPIQALLTKGIKHFKWWFFVMVLTVLFNSFYGKSVVGESYQVDFRFWELAAAGTIFLVSVTAAFYLLYVLLGDAYAKMREKNKEIERLNAELFVINNSLEDRVTKRTKDIEDQKSILEKLAFMNSHIVRSSLSRIIGAAAVLEIDKEKSEEMIDVIITSSNELDNSVREMGKELS